MPAAEVNGVEGMKGLVGQEVGPSEWRTITQADIDAFAKLSGDHQWIHVDPERAKTESPYGTTIAHGNLTLATVDGFRTELINSTGFALGVNYGWNKIRLPAPRQSRGRLRRRQGRQLVRGHHPLHPRSRGSRQALLRRRLGDAGHGSS